MFGLMTILFSAFIPLYLKSPYPAELGDGFRGLQLMVRPLQHNERNFLGLFSEGSGKTGRHLNVFCHSLIPLDLENFDIALSVLHAAVNYKMDRVIQRISRRLFDPSCCDRCIKREYMPLPKSSDLSSWQNARVGCPLTLTTDATLHPSVKESRK